MATLESKIRRQTSDHVDIHCVDNQCLSGRGGDTFGAKPAGRDRTVGFDAHCTHPADPADTGIDSGGDS